MSKPKIILIAGPTASGKSALALDLAHKTSGTIINTDAMQVYSSLPILTAQPTAQEQKRVPHRLYGILDPLEKSSAGKWLSLALRVIQETLDVERTPILVGGTGFYFSALLGGLSEIPAIPDSVRDETQELYDSIGEEEFRKKLADLDAESAARLSKNDRQRLIRSYEVAIHTGKPLEHWHKASSDNHLKDFDIVPYLLMPARSELYAACDRRFEDMTKKGAIEEVKQLLERNLDPILPAMKVLGIRELADYLNGTIKLEEAIIKGQQATRNYAKRQMTWFRNQWPFNK